MIRAQRRVHLLVWLLAPIGLLALIAWSLSVRPSWNAPASKSSAAEEVTP
ncbi:MAG: hypothetical protein AAF138_04720 [Planctomycetota bacterium]